MKDHILLISNMYPNKKNLSFGVFVKNQVDSLREKGVKADLVVISNDKSGKIHVLKKYTIWVFKAFFKLLFKYKKYSVVHAHYVFPSGLLALLFKKMRSIPYVVTAHGGDIDRMPYKNRLIYRITAKVLREADAVIAVGEKLKEDITNNFQVRPDNIHLLNMGVNREIFKPMGQGKARGLLGIPYAQKRLLFVGNIIKAKGVNELISSFAELTKSFKDLHLDIIGAQKDPLYYRDVKDQISQLSVNNITFHSPKTQEEIATWMSAADIFVLPSHIEGFGLVALEAMSTNTPVVGTEVGGLSYLLRNDVGVLVEPENEQSLEIGIRGILESEKLKSSLIKKGEDKARENDHRQIVTYIITIYNKIEGKYND